MAKKPGAMHRRNPFTRHETNAQFYQYNAGRFSAVGNTDIVPPRPEAPSYNQEAETPLRQPLGFITVGGREKPIFAPIPGFEELFNVCDQNGAGPSLAGPIQCRGPQPKEPIKSRKSTPSSTTRGTKRSRVEDHGYDYDTDDEDDQEPTVSTTVTESFHVGDIEALKSFYETRFRELTMKPMRDIVTTWVKRLEPRRQQQHGPYQRYADRRGAKPKAYTKPPWWPNSVPYVEPSHLKLQHLIPLAVTIMFIHRQNDERKRKQDPWVQKLKDDAIYLAKSKATEHFSSSKGPAYNEAMKRRALEVILPSLFSIAQSHEDYVYQEQAFEGSGKLNPGCGKLVFWQHTPRPDRTHTWKRPSKHSRIDPPLEYDASGDTEPDEEPDEEVLCPNSSFSSFKSDMSFTEDAEVYPEVSQENTSPMNVVAESGNPITTHNLPLPSDVVVTESPMDQAHINGMTSSVVPSSFSCVPTTIDWPYQPHYFLTHGPQNPPFVTQILDQPPFHLHDYPHNIPMHTIMEHYPPTYLPTSNIPTHGLPLY